MKKDFKSTRELAMSITSAASLQTAYTIRFLADRELAADAFKAYAYFRWVDDWVDQESLPRDDRLAFIARQNLLIRDFPRGVHSSAITAEEQILADLIHRDAGASKRSERSGLRSYIHNMMAVMAFDAERKGRLITRAELTTYAHTLAVAVTEALHYFIGHNDYSPAGEARYLAVTGAHITHMLRDTLEDNAAGYFNIPAEYLEARHISPLDVASDPYRDWVKDRVRLARSYFKAGRDNMTRVENLRCRLAGYAYIARFEVVLDLIERDDYRLRASYAERKSLASGARMTWSTLWSALNEKAPQPKSRALIVR